MAETEHTAVATRQGGLLWPTIAAVVVLAILFSLGTWQLQRKAWKEDLIAKIEARSHAVPLPLADAARRVKAGEDLEYARVQVSGRFDDGKVAYLFAPGPAGPGWHVYSAMEPAGGGSLIVNRGFVPDDAKGRIAGPAHPGEVQITGLLRLPERRTLFTPDNDAGRNIWYWRDLAGMARAMRLEGAGLYPFFIDAEASARPPVAGEPQGGVTRVVLSNRHLEYAVTWYGLGLTLIGVYLAFVWQRLRASRHPQR